MARKTFKFKLYASKKNKILYRQIILAAEIYNRCIALHRRYYRRTGKFLNKFRLQKLITQLKKRVRFQHWNDLNSQAIQEITERIDKGYKLFFGENAKGNKKIRPPRYKQYKNYKSYTLKQTGYKYLEGNRIQIGRRIYQFFQSRDIDGEIKTLTIKRDSLGDFYLCFSCLVDDDAPTSNVTTGQSAGFDFGLKTFLTGSDSKEWKAPQPLKTALKELKAASRALSSKVDGSRNRKRAKDHLARVHRRIANVRNDYQWKLARELVDTYDELYFETLAFQGMKARWGRKLSDLAPANFLGKVAYLAVETGKLYVQIDRWEPSSKRCSVCLEINDKLELKDREWTCPCGIHHHRDINAAKNILRVGTSTHKGVGNKTVLLPASNDDLRIPRL